MEVCEGELVHLLGKVISMDGNKITMIPKHEDLKVFFYYCCPTVQLKTKYGKCGMLFRLILSFMNLGSVRVPSA